MIPEHLKTDFQFGTSKVSVLHGDIFNILEQTKPGALVINGDNYLTMSAGLPAAIYRLIGGEFARQAQELSPVKSGTVVVSDLHQFTSEGSDNSNESIHALPRYIFHAAVVDYDFSGSSLEELIAAACVQSLEKAESMGIRNLAVQVFGLDKPMLAMNTAARSVCGAVKTFLAEERNLKEVILILEGPAQTNAYEDINFRRVTDFLREANAILGTPYDPQDRVRQARDFFAREAEMELLERLLTDQVPGKKHLLLSGGAGTGKWMLLDQLYYRSQIPGSTLGQGRRFFRVNFTSNVPVGDDAFLFRKLIIAMLRDEAHPDRRARLRHAYASEDMDSGCFLELCSDLADDSLELVFLCDGIPLDETLAQAQFAGAVPEVGTYQIKSELLSFYHAVEAAQHKVRFFFASPSEDQFVQPLLLAAREAPLFSASLEHMVVGVVTEAGRTDWVDAVYQRYMGVTDLAPLEFHRFIDETAGVHPFSISLGCSLMLNRMKRVVLNSPQILSEGWNRAILRAIAENSRKLIDQLLREFFEYTYSVLPHKAAVDLYHLARAVISEEQVQILGPALAMGDLNAHARLGEIIQQGDPRDLLHKDTIQWLVDHGLVYRGQNGKEQLSIPFLASFILEKMGGLKRLEDRPADVSISLLYHHHSGSGRRAEKSTIRTMFNSRGGRVLAAEKQFASDLRKDFLENFNRFLDHRRRSIGKDENIPDLVFRNVEEIGNFLLSQYATMMVKNYLEQPPPNCTINFLVDEALKDIPWELMLEAAYAGEIPFRVGRSIISNQPPGLNNPPVRGPGAVRALLVGDPTGDLQAAVYEIEWLASALDNSPYFGDVEVFMGRDMCHRIKVLNALSSGKFGLVHYSGHSHASGNDSAWILSDGDATTSTLTSAIQSAPPTMVFSSSCFSGAGEGWQPVEYENQAFDLPGAFLGAGVEAYVGTLWAVEEDAARRLVERFYASFLIGDVSIGECLRRARQSLKLEQERRDQIDWLAFILYGDPRLLPGEFYPVFRGK